jgi:hypothetical protein
MTIAERAPGDRKRLARLVRTEKLASPGGRSRATLLVIGGEEAPVIAHMPTNRTIDYLEISVINLTAAKRFYQDVFGWSFTDYGPTYASFARSEAGIDGGFEQVRVAAAEGAGVGGAVRDGP